MNDGLRKEDDDSMVLFIGSIFNVARFPPFLVTKVAVVNAAKSHDVARVVNTILTQSKVRWRLPSLKVDVLDVHGIRFWIEAQATL